MRIWLEFPVVLPIRTLLRLQILLYSHLNQRQHLDPSVVIFILQSRNVLFAIWVYSSFIINHDFHSFT